jgi:hypothetical protein
LKYFYSGSRSLNNIMKHFLLISSFVLLLSSCVSQNSIEDLNTISKSVMAKGYVVLRDREQAFCEDHCQTYSYAFFVFQENKELQRFTQKNTGNAFVKNSAIGMGCITKDGLAYTNNAVIGNKSETLSIDFTNALLQSNKDNLVELSFKKEIAGPGQGANNCYSHFRDFSL